MLQLMVTLYFKTVKGLRRHALSVSGFIVPLQRSLVKQRVRVVSAGVFMMAAFCLNCGMDTVYALSELQELERDAKHEKKRIEQIARTEVAVTEKTLGVDDSEDFPAVEEKEHDVKTAAPAGSAETEKNVNQRASAFAKGGEPTVSVSTEKRSPCSPDKDVLRDFNLGVYHQKHGDNKKAIEMYEKALQQDPDNAEIHNNLGVIYKEQGNLDRAVEHFMRVVSLNPGMDEAHNNLGVIHLLRGDQREAELEFRKALELNPQNPESQINLGLVYKAQGLDEQAIDAMEKVLSAEPFHPEAHYNLAVLYEKLGHLERAIWHYERFIHNAGNRYAALAGDVTEHIEKLKITSGDVLVGK